MNPPARAAVVGAGIAGLSCATLLQSAGFEVSVFDKSRGPSGRMSTRRGDDWQCDHGAQYFTARDPGFRAEVARWQHASVAASWRPRLHVLGDPSAHVPDPALERFVGLPRMSAPCRFLADGLDLEVDTGIRQLQRRADGWHLLSAERGWLDRSFDAALLVLVVHPENRHWLLWVACCPPSRNTVVMRQLPAKCGHSRGRRDHRAG